MISFLLVALLLLQEDPNKFAFEEKLWGRLPVGLTDVRTVFGPAGSWACAAKKDGKEFVVTPEKSGTHFDRVGTPRISADGRTVAYSARTGDKELVMVGTKQGEWFDSVSDLFILTDARAAYIANGALRVAVIIGTSRNDYDHVFTLVASPDEKTVAFIATYDGKRILYRGDKATTLDVEEASHLTFNPDGTLLACKGVKNGKQFIVVDGKPGASYESVGRPFFHPDGRTIVHIANNGPGNTFLCVGATLGPTVDQIDAHSLAFSPGGKALAYVATKKGKSFIVVDDKPREEYDQVFPPAFGPDGKTVAYVAKKGSTHVLVVGETKTEFKAFDRPGRPFFSPDGSRAAFILHGEKSVAVWAGQEWDLVDEMTDPAFSPNGKKIAFTCRDGRDICRKVIDLK